MTISLKLRNYMDRCGVEFDEVPHAYAFQPSKAAEATHIPGRRVAKGVLVRAGDEYMMAVVPSSKLVAFGDLGRWLGREVRLADEQESVSLFADCELGALPPVGAAFGLQTILDEELLDAEDIYFEGGDHRTLIHVQGQDWRRLQHDAGHCALSA
ncbi:MAG TPA: YbaK/EbsC family protein [Phenylobacterium sp.]|uniref:aminoacyl-tRNA deacylase n=1 Tax=Phenylobacterium sp. TaxID=1871053 RepID=UPI002B478957|nr:YbaK/EbsC family protein [Phenylobacterium sp.]HKR87285.1 YbaK/EbsC family protein [Phenylobacterium sp.]HKT53272.1 YbaK/EbsC family protein [Caulobacteraceae bacterium]